MGKVHIGMILNLEKDTDVAINNILNNLPSYESKSKYLRQAILFYEKHKGKEVVKSTSETSIQPVLATQQSSEIKELLNTIGTLAKSLEDVKKEITDIKNNEEVPTKAVEERKQTEKKEKQSKSTKPIPKPEPEVETEEPTSSEDEIVVNNDTKASSVSYADFMGDFLS